MASDEHFFTAHVSRDTKVIGLEHPTDADWADVLAAQIALRDHLDWRIRHRGKCPYNGGI